MKRRDRWLFPAALGVCLLSAVLSLSLGAAAISPAALWDALVSGPESVGGRIFWYARLPRTAGCLLAGAALSAAGCIIQNVLSNPLASPNVIGINAGAALAVTVCCAFGAVSGWAVTVSGFLGAFAAAALVALASQRTGASRSAVILGGVAVNAFLGALRDTVTTLFPDAAILSGDFRVGGFGSVAASRLIPAAVLILLALGISMALCNELELLSLGEETARGLGLKVPALRLVFLLLAAVLSGAAVSFAGLLGFVGLIVPHAVRRFTGGVCRLHLPLSALVGAAFVTACDVLARVLFRPHELPVGILLSALGGPFFLNILTRRKGGHGDG